MGSLPKYTCQSLVCYIKCTKNGERFSVRLGNDLWEDVFPRRMS